MATAYKSQPCTDREAGDFINPAYMLPDRQKTVVTVAVAADIAAGDTIDLLRLPSSARIVDVEVCNDDLGDTLTVDVGVGYPNDGAAPTEIDADCLADGYAAGTAAAVFGTIFGLGGKPAPEDFEDTRLWVLAGLTADPECELVVYADVDAETNGAAGDITFRITWASEMGGS